MIEPLVADVAQLSWRIRERLRPWAAPAHVPGGGSAIVIGAGPAGLATAALLRRQGVDARVIDRADGIGGSWPHRYDSLRLNTVRWMSDLPGYRMSRRLGRWVDRDDIAEYLRRYAEHHAVPVELGVGVLRIDPVGSQWQAQTDRRHEPVEPVDAVVVASGHSAVPTMPDWPGAGAFGGRLMHAAAYRRPADHADRRVLVVGAGSSGGEICVDLARAGVDVTWAVGTAPRVFPREVLRVPATPLAPLGDALPDRWLDRLAPRLERAVYGRRDYLPEPTEPMMRLLARCKEPMTADGIVELVRSRRVRVVTAVDDLTPAGALLTDGTDVDVDDVIAATGYRPGLEPLVGHLGVLDGSGRPTAVMPRSGLGFVGFRIPFTGTLWAIETDARAVARQITDSL